METSRANRSRRVHDHHERNARHAVELGVIRRLVEDDRLTGPEITLDGRPVVNFGSCSYLGLNLDRRLQDAAIDAIDRFGVTHSSSAQYTALGMYGELESALGRMTGGDVVVTTTTTLAHLSALPVLVRKGDLVLVDALAHASLRLTTQVLASQGATIEIVPHNDMDALEQAVGEAVGRRTWYLADGLYSMFGDFAPVRRIGDLLERNEHLWLYLDDAHAFSWYGEQGRGWVLEHLPFHPRMAVSISLSKSFAGGGGAVAFGDPELATRVRLVGPALTFGGPLQIAELGAGLASAAIHMSPELAELQSRLHRQMDLVRRTCRRLALPLMVDAQSPIWFVRVGRIEDMLEVARRLLADGFYTNPSGFPIVPLGHAGIRFTQTLLHSDDQIESLLERMAHHIQDVVGEGLHVTIDLTDAAMAVQRPRSAAAGAG